MNADERCNKMHEKFMNWYQDAWEVFERQFEVTSLLRNGDWDEGISNRNQIYRRFFDDDRDPIFLPFIVGRAIITEDITLFHSTYNKFVEVHGFIEPECFFPASWEEVRWMW